MSIFRRNRTGIVNVRMVITEEKILSNIDKVQKMINPNSKKQIVELEEDGYFKDLIESIKMYLIEYPKKKNFPSSVYNAAYGLVEYATNQFEENTKQIESLIRQREVNINLGTDLKGILEVLTHFVKNILIAVDIFKPKFLNNISLSSLSVESTLTFKFVVLEVLLILSLLLLSLYYVPKHLPMQFNYVVITFLSLFQKKSTFDFFRNKNHLLIS